MKFEDGKYSEHACDESLHRIAVMLSQEEENYIPLDYIALHNSKTSNFHRLCSCTDGDGMHKVENEKTHCENVAVSAEWRAKIASWYALLVKTFKFKSEVVSFAMNFLDRMLSIYFCDRMMLELTASTAFYLAVKVHDSGKVDSLKILPRLSQVGITSRHIVQMEIFMLRSLNWYLSPPIAEGYLFNLLSVLSHNFSLAVEESQRVKWFSQTCCTLASGDYFFVAQKPSNVALASILNALQFVYPQDNGDIEVSAAIQFSQVLNQFFPSMEVFSKDSEECCTRMFELLKMKGNAIGITIPCTDSSKGVRVSESDPDSICSPVCVGDTKSIC